MITCGVVVLAVVLLVAFATLQAFRLSSQISQDEERRDGRMRG